MKRALTIALLLSLSLTHSALADQTGIKSVTGTDLPISGGENLGLVVTAEGGSSGFPGGRALFANGIKLNDEALACSSATQGMLRFNSTSLAFEGCNGTSWISLSSNSLPTKDCKIMNNNGADILTQPRTEAPRCPSGYYLKALIKVTNDAWDSYGAICCNSDANVVGSTYNTTVALCKSYGKSFLTCPPTD